MSTILVEVKNQGFMLVTVQKASTGATIATIGKGEPSKTFSLRDGFDSVQISVASPEAATVLLEGGEDETPVSVHGAGVEKELYVDEPLSVHLSTSTILTLQSTDMSRTAPRVDSPDGVKCGEVVIQPEPV